MNPKQALDPISAPKGRGIIPSDFVGIVQLSILIHCVLKIKVSRINVPIIDLKEDPRYYFK